MKPLHSVLEVGIVGATNCVTDPQGKFKQDYGECIFGTLSEAEAKTSDAMVRAWTNFAIYGYVLCKFYQALLDQKRVKKIHLGQDFLKKQFSCSLQFSSHVRI